MSVTTFAEAVWGKKFGLFNIYQQQIEITAVDRLGKYFGEGNNEMINRTTSLLDEEYLHIKEKLQVEAPNLSLNIPGAIPSRSRIWALAAIGLFFQVVVLAIGGLSVYR